ncbi:TonB-dependent receptor [Sphingomonas solaris]|uniref:TonB-dependent receptor n=1 Tax=Alterirhizorhabdus solaris TaxID=2529389 RepID=A0A558RBQ3_9SPHN|nr:TonB-dependent receptor [Sphingomonas solaris]TVV76839.1 TonB-dependent receptor [Sphingomonas solaris]
MTGTHARTMTLLLAGVAFVPYAALAQEAAPPAPATAVAPEVAAAPASAADTGEIVVTARFRTESLNSVPIAITALRGDSLAEKNLNNLQDIAAIVPTVDFRAGASNKDRTIFIRGIGTVTTSPGVESSVSTVVDGVVLVRPGQQTLDLGEIDRVEVLRGPQGTLFGKNASAGVINIVTKAPTDTDYGHAEAGYYEGGEYRLKATVSGPIVPGKLDYLLSGLAGGWKGNVRDLASDSRVNGYFRRGVRGKLRWTPTETLSVTAAADYLYQRDDVPTGVAASTGRRAYPTGAFTNSAVLPAYLAAQGITASPSNRTIRSSFVSEVRDKNYGGSVTPDLELGGFTLTSITAYREWKNRQHQDQDNFAELADGQPPLGIPQGEDRGTVDFNQFSQELRLTSPKGGFLDYVLGAYYLRARTDETYRRDIRQNLATANLPGRTAVVIPYCLGEALARHDCGVADYGIVSKNYSLFGEANLNFTPAFRAIAGGRLIHDRLSSYHNRISTAGFAAGSTINGDVPAIQPNHSSTGSTSRTDFSARAGLQYDITPDVNAYATYSRGYKGQAYNVFFNMRSFDEAPLKPETSNSYEIGFKGSALDRRVNFALAGYITKFDNFQANFSDFVNGAVLTRLINAGKVSTRGVEGDISVRPVDPLALSFAFARTDARVDSFICPAGASANCNIDGQPLPFSQKWKLHGEGTYTVPLGGDYGLELNTDYTWKSKTQYQLDQRPDTIQPAYGIWNASIALVGKGDAGAWQIRAVVKNIADRNYSSFLLQSGAGNGLVRFVPRDAARYFGVNVATDF